MKSISNFFSPQKAINSSFSEVMALAEEIAAINPEGLTLLVRALLRPIQAEHMLAVAERPQHQAPGSLDYISFFFNLNTVAESSEFYLRHKPEFRINLSKDIVLPTPWKRDRYANALATIGAGKCQGEWEQDGNHSIAVWWPWRIAFVLGGNHSITAGILLGEGELLATEVYDLTPIFERVICDGITYRDIKTGKILGKVNDTRRAAAFEIGRLMIKYKLPNLAQIKE